MKEDIAVQQIMDIIGDTRPDKKKTYRMSFSEKGQRRGGMGRSCGIFVSPIEELFYGDRKIDHVIYELSSWEDPERVRRDILNTKYTQGWNITTKKTSDAIVVYPNVPEPTFNTPLRVKH